MFPLTATEIERLTISGVKESSLIFLQGVLKWHYVQFAMLALMTYGGIALVSFSHGFSSMHPLASVVSIALSIALPMALVIALGSDLMESLPWRPLHRDRMALNLIRLVRLLMKFDDHPGGGIRLRDKLIEIYSLELKTRGFSYRTPNGWHGLSRVTSRSRVENLADVATWSLGLARAK
jgi:hypothetical protein